MNGFTYWLSWIENGSDGRARAGFRSDGFPTLEKAVEDLERVREDDKVVCSWVDCYGPDNKKVGTPVMECYVNFVGDREMWRFKDPNATEGGNFHGNV